MKRISTLDSLRGIAALSVVGFHCIDKYFEYFPKDNVSIIDKVLLRSLFNGTDWVSFFFVLSGFTLSYKYIVIKNEIKPINFYISRVFRIYPLYITILIIAFFFDNSSYSFKDLILESFLINFRNKILFQGWSLSVELMLSLFFPLFIYTALKNKSFFTVFTFISLLFYNHDGQFQSHFQGFIFHFLLGILLCLNLDKLENKTLKWKHILILLLPIFLFSSRWYVDCSPITRDFIIRFCDYINMDYHQFFSFLSAISSVSFIILTLKINIINQFLNLKPLVFLGKISFSIYLWHTIIIANYPYFGFYEIFSNRLTRFFFHFTIISIITIIFSVLTYFLIERPFIVFIKKNKTVLS